MKPINPNIDKIVSLARKDMEKEDYDAALRKYFTLCEMGVEEGVVYNAIGYIYLRNHCPVQALPHLRKASELEPYEPAVYVNLGSAYVMMNNVDEAMNQLETAVEFGQRDEDILDELISYHEDNHDYKKSTYYSQIKEGLVEP